MTTGLGPISGEIKVVLSIDDAKLKQFFGAGVGGGFGIGILTQPEWLERRRESMRERLAGLGRYTPPGTQRDELLQILASTKEERKGRQDLSRMFLRHIPLIGAIAGGVAGAVLLLGQILSHSQILSTFTKTYLRVFGAFVDILLIPFVPFLRLGLIIFIKLFPILFALSSWLSKATDWMTKNPELAVIGTLMGSIVAGKLAEIIASRFPLPPTGRIPAPTGAPPAGPGAGAGAAAFARWIPILGAAALTAIIPGDVPRGIMDKIYAQKREREIKAHLEWQEAMRAQTYGPPVLPVAPPFPGRVPPGSIPHLPAAPLRPFEMSLGREPSTTAILQFIVQPKTHQELIQDVIAFLRDPIAQKAFENQWMGAR